MESLPIDRDPLFSHVLPFLCHPSDDSLDLPLPQLLYFQTRYIRITPIIPNNNNYHFNQCLYIFHVLSLMPQ